METFANRLQSFETPKVKSSGRSVSKTWPHPQSFHATPNSLAEAGFFFKPSKDGADNVQCFICKKELGGWDKEDNPFEVHVEKCPKCPWAIARCSLEFDADPNGNFSFDEPSRLPSSKILEKARLDTFGGKKWWPHDSVKSHGATSKKMSKAGFVYTPQSIGDDTATCFYCDLSLSGWDVEDDPVEEHHKREKKMGKSCPFFRTEMTSTSRNDQPLKKSRTRSKANTASVSGRGRRRAVAVAKDERGTDSVDENTKPKSTRSRSKANSEGKDKEKEQEKPPSNVDGKVTKRYEDFAIEVDDGEGRGTKKLETESAQGGISRSRSRSKSMPRSTRARSQESAPAPASARKGKKQNQALNSSTATMASKKSLKPSAQDEESEEMEENDDPSLKVQLNPAPRKPARKSPSKSPERPITPEHQVIRTTAFEMALDASVARTPSVTSLFVPPLADAPLEVVDALTEEERAMTVEQWIRHEMEVQYSKLKEDGERRIQAFREQAKEARKTIEAL